MSEKGRVWNYRILKQISPSTDEEWFEMVEVHYDQPDGRPVAYSDNCTFFSNTEEGLKWVLEKYAEALTKPVLTLADFNLSEQKIKTLDPLDGLDAFLKSKPNIVKALKKSLDEISAYLENGFQDYFLQNLDSRLRSELEMLRRGNQHYVHTIHELNKQISKLKGEAHLLEMDNSTFKSRNVTLVQQRENNARQINELRELIHKHGLGEYLQKE